MPLRAAIVALTLVCTLAAPTQAQAQSLIIGGGWGHGIGMSQYGAKGQAQAGRSYRTILAHYYRGTRLGSAPAKTVRVILARNQSRFTVAGAVEVNGRPLSALRRYTLVLYKGQAALKGAKGKPRRLGDQARIRGDRLLLEGPAENGVTAGHYRGDLNIRVAENGGLNAINHVPMELYLRGVVPAESPAAWPLEALKAQAVAARSYALATGQGAAQYDHTADTRSQMYRGLDGEQARTTRAVSATAGQVLTYKSRPIPAYFHSTSGGHTESVQNVWGSPPRPYLKGVRDPYDKGSPHHRWTKTYSQAQMQNRLHGLVKGRYRTIIVTRRGVSPRVVTAEVVGSRGRTRTTGNTLMRRLGLRDTWFTVKERTPARPYM